MVSRTHRGRSAAWGLAAAAFGATGCAASSGAPPDSGPVQLSGSTSAPQQPTFVLANTSRPSRDPDAGAEAPSSEVGVSHEVVAICEGARVEPQQPTCRMTEAQSSAGLRFGTHRLRGGVKWCAGREPLPWISSARAAKLDATYEELGLHGRPDSPGAGLTKVISHHYAIVEIAERPFLVSTSGQALPLRWGGGMAHHDRGTPAAEILTGGTYPPTKGALLRMPDELEPIYSIARDGTVIEVPRPDPDARYVGFSEGGGGHDSLWRWPSRTDGARGETWAVVHHGPDGSPAGTPDLYDAPGACAGSGSTSGLRFSTGVRGVRFAVDGARLCLDRARGEEDRSYWRTSSAGPGRSGTERVTCASWKLEVVPSGSGLSPGKLAVRYLER